MKNGLPLFPLSIFFFFSSSMTGARLREINREIERRRERTRKKGKEAVEIGKREILFTPKEFLYTPYITHNPFLHPISLMGCIEKFLGCK